MRGKVCAALFAFGAAVAAPITGSAGFDEGARALRDGNETAALREFRAAAAAGHAAAQYNLGVMHLHGTGLPKDVKSGLGWLAKAADSGDVAAMGLLGALYLGRGEAPQDYKKALGYLAAAAGHGDAIAQNNLAVMHLYGWGTSVDRVAAYYWAARAERGGLEQAGGLRQTIAAQIPPGELAAAERRLAGDSPAGAAAAVDQPAAANPLPVTADKQPPAAAPVEPPAPAAAPVAVVEPQPPPPPVRAEEPPAIVAAAKEVPTSPEATPPTAAPAAKAAAGFRAHIASVRRPEEAPAEWKRLSRVGKELLAGMTPAYEDVDLGEKGRYVRIFVGAFDDFAAAKAFCDTLVAGRLKCRPARIR